MALQRLKEAAEKAKSELSTTLETEINLPFVTADASGPKHLSLRLSRAKLEQLVDDLLERSMGPVRQCLKDAGVEPKDIDEVVLVGGMTRMPKIQELVKSFFGKEPHKGVNPDEVVAIGAAVQAGILSGDVKDVLLLDVTPLSLGVETLGGITTKLIERNTTIPAKKTEVFSTAADNQTSVEIHALQGEREMARDNRTLGRFHLSGIPSAPRGVPQIEVTFDIDANGILNVSAKDTATGKSQNITITASSGLAKEEVEKMVNEAKSHAEDDKKSRELAQARNEADTLAYSLEKLLKDNRERVSESDAKAIDEAVAEVRKALEGDDVAAIRSAAERATQLSHRMAETLYQKTASAGAAPHADAPPSGKPDDVVDAEYTVKE
jgi:molecular chaperone DnaK